MRRSLRAAALAGICALAVAVPLFGQVDVPEGKWWKAPRLASEIGLSPDQSRDIEQIFVKSRPRLIDLKADLEKKQLVLQTSLEDPQVERRAVEKQIEAVETARAELQKTRAMMVLDMKRVLKPDQWERLLQIQQSVRAQRREIMRERIQERRNQRFAGPERARPQRQPGQPPPPRPQPAPKEKSK